MNSLPTKRLLAGLVLASCASGVAAAPYCCPCKSGEPQAVDAADDLKAGFQCTVACKRFTLARPGACEPAAAPSAQPAAVSPSGSSVLLYKNGDCSGDIMKIDKSTAQLEAGAFYSFAVEAGGPASAFSEANFAGTRTAPVAPSICISPGFSISAIRVGAQ